MTVISGEKYSKINSHVYLNSNVKSSIVEERIRSILFVPSIVEGQILWFVFVPSIVWEQIKSFFYVPLIVEGRIH